MAEDRGVALAAVVVAGVIGVAGPLITWGATRDAGEFSAEAELVRGDRQDLRRVLDVASSRLERASNERTHVNLRWERAVRPLPLAVRQKYNERIDEVQFSADQLLIRLGPDSPVYKPYANALLQLRRQAVHTVDQPVPSLIELENQNAAALFHAQNRFRAEAHALAKSVVE